MADVQTSERQAEEDIEIFVHVSWSDSAKLYFFYAGRTLEEAERAKSRPGPPPVYAVTTSNEHTKKAHDAAIKRVKERYCKHLREGYETQQVKNYTVRTQC